MVRFSCFNAHNHSHKPKKAAELSVETKCGTSPNNLTVKDPKTSPRDSTLNSVFLKAFGSSQVTEGTDDVRSSISIDRSWKSEEVKEKLNVNGDLEVHQMGFLKKSRSLGSGLCHEGRVLSHNDTEEETDLGFSSDSPGQNGLVEPKDSKSPCLSPTSEHHEPPQSESVQVGSDFVNDESNFSMGDPQHSEKDRQENSDSPISGEVVDESGNHVSSIPRMIVKSHSLPTIRHSTPSSGECFCKCPAPSSRSSEDLRVLEMKSKEVSFHEAERWVMQDREKDYVLRETQKNNFENYVDDGYDTYDYSTLAKDWIMPVTDELNMAKNIQGESSYQQSDESPGKDFKMKRVQEWVNDLSHCIPLEENNVLSESDDPIKHDSSYSNGPAATKMDNKVTSPGMEAAKRYISSLNASAAAAQLSNHELVAIPFLSAFASMRVLNLSGNSIARITSGSLPRGLHVLNLSKNSISAIEGLRDLARLRVLDLSYNRILRIGHGLASCSPLKELYLAGNKISEVEGLHRLLKLAVLDLRFNKISTAKCLGQLAANYNSLQAISLEGNPAQKNVGDEQLKKYLQGLLPHLVYCNRQPIKASTLKDAADRSVRLGISAHQFDRELRSDKGARKASHGVSSRPSSSATHGRKNQGADSPKRSRGRHVRLPPPSGTRAAASRHHNFDVANRILQLKSEFSMRRSRSEGTLGAL